MLLGQGGLGKRYCVYARGKMRVSDHDVTIIYIFTGVVVPLTAVPATVSESSDEGIGSMSPEPVAIVTNTSVSTISGLDSGDPSREMIELRVQLDRERRLRMHLEDQVSHFRSLSKLIQAVTLLTCIWVVPGLNLGPYTDYPDRFFVVFPSSWGKCYNNTSKWALLLPPRLFQFVIRYHPTIRHYVV